MLPHERIGILRVAQASWIQHAQRRCLGHPHAGFDGSREPIATRYVVIEGQHHRVDAQPKKSAKGVRWNACATHCDDRTKAMSAKLVDVHESFDEHNLVALNGWETKKLGHPVWRKPGAACASEVEVTRGGVRVPQRTSPERPDPTARV